MTPDEKHAIETVLASSEPTLRVNTGPLKGSTFNSLSDYMHALANSQKQCKHQKRFLHTIHGIAGANTDTIYAWIRIECRRCGQVLDFRRTPKMPNHQPH